MRKKIPTADLIVGMYLDEVPGSWLDNPVWRSHFVITDPKLVARFKASNIGELWIDTAKGLDVGAPHAAPDRRGGTGVQLTSARAPDIPAPPTTLHVPIAGELERAARICADSKKAITSMFREARMGNALDAVVVGQLVDDISDSVARNVSALISLARLKTADDYTYMHSVAVCAMMIALARQLGLNEADTRSAGTAGLLHDIGKLLIAPSVLNKPGKLTEPEFATVMRHPELGHGLLDKMGNVDPMALEVCLHHHEKMDGSGYPHGLKGEQISLYARMGAVCDVYDAITSNRPYKDGWDPSEAMRRMGQWTQGHFDPAVFQAFARTLGIYPAGSLVRLTSGRIAVVLEQSPSSLTTPVVKAFFSTKSGERFPPERIDLGVPGGREKIVAREDPAKWNFRGLNELWSGQAPA
jgi:putative nucleotidyltransferase with HDIG domain